MSFSERILNTLSHEACHLACWLIDNDLKEMHGKLWNRWSQKVMDYRADIQITVSTVFLSVRRVLDMISAS